MAKQRRQVGAIPFLRKPDGTLNVLLVTSRETGRWVIPKGWPMKSRSAGGAAAQEAFEEAGVRGRIRGGKLGRYHYPKRLRDGSVVPCVVHVFPLLVEHLADTWPEHDERRREWFTPSDAAGHVAEPELSEILLAFDRTETAVAAKRAEKRTAKKADKARRRQAAEQPAVAKKQVEPAD